MTSYESTTMRMVQQELGACTLIQDLLPLYLEGEVSPGSRDLIVEHLARCERCAGFLAGAQSVRVQLRREGDQRAALLKHDQPVQQAVGAGQRRVAVIMLLAFSVLGAAGSVFGGLGIDKSAPVLFGVGLVIGLTGFGGIVALARKHGALTPARLLSLSLNCLMGALGAIFIAAPSEPFLKLFGIFLEFVALFGLWFAIVPGAPRISVDQVER
jgi:predicted anti-sigma-YlaC factor YlaD